MSFRTVSFAFILLVFIAIVESHRPGEEYTYMSMFVKPQTPDMIDGDNHLGQVYEQLSIHPKLAPRSLTRRNLRSQSKSKEEDSEEETEEEDQDTSTNLKSEEQVRELDNQTLPRLSMSDDSKVAVKVSEEMFVEEDEDEEDEEDIPFDRQSLPSRFGSVRLKTDEQVKETKQSSEGDIIEHLGKKYGENLDRVQQMLLKIIRKYDIDSLADVPCRAHAHWMPSFLEKLTDEKKSFKYYCVDTNKEVLRSMKEAIGKLGKSKFILRRFWKEGIPRADLVFSWAGLDNMKPDNVNKYLKRLSKTGSKHKLIAIGSHAGALRKKGSKSQISRFTAGGRPINFRERPFKLKKPMRIIGELSTEGNDKQLYLYKADDMMR